MGDFILNLAVVFQEAMIIMWAVKPQIFPNAVESIDPKKIDTSPAAAFNGLHLSVMAGVPLMQINTTLNSLYGTHGYEFRIIRIMPNLGLKVYSGVAGRNLH